MIAVIDTETTGLDPATASIVEIAAVMLPGFESFSCIVKPEHPIEIQAMAAHHLTEAAVADGAPIADAVMASMIESADFVAAHHAAFDMGFVKIDKPVICTWRCARHLWQDAPSYSNQVLRYWIGMEDELHSGDGARIMMLPPHRALPDAWVTAHILNKMLAFHGNADIEMSPEALVELTKKPILMKTVGFGMHFGKLWSDVPRDYLKWMTRQDFDADAIYTAKHHLGLL